MVTPEIVHYVGNQIYRDSVSDRGQGLCHNMYSHEANQKVFDGPMPLKTLKQLCTMLRGHKEHKVLKQAEWESKPAVICHQTINPNKFSK